MKVFNIEESINTKQNEEFKTLPNLLRFYSKNKPNGVAIRQKRFGLWKELTWRQYEKLSINCGCALLDLGFKKEENIAILSENRQEWLISELGMHLVGLVPVGVYPTSPSNEILHILLSTNAKAVICEDQEQVDKIIEIKDSLPLLDKIICIDNKGLNSYTESKIIFWNNFLLDGSKKFSENPNIISECLRSHSPDDTALIVPTSGSTGPPKPAMISFRNISFIGKSTSEVIERKNSDNVVSYLPLCHVAEQLFSVFIAMHGGYTANFGESIRTVQQDLRDIAPTIFLGVPRIWELLKK